MSKTPFRLGLRTLAGALIVVIASAVACGVAHIAEYALHSTLAVVYIAPRSGTPPTITCGPPTPLKRWSWRERRRQEPKSAPRAAHGTTARWLPRPRQKDLES